MPLNDELAVALEDAYAAGYKAGQRNEPHDGLPHPRADRARRAKQERQHVRRA